MTIRKIFNTALTVLVVSILTACSSFENEKRIVIPAAPPLPADALERTAQSCRKDIENLRSRISYVPEERRKEFKTVMDLAEDTCDSMVDTLDRLKTATRQEQTLKQSLQHAEATVAQDAMAPGTTAPIPNNAMNDPSASISEDINTQPIPQDTASSGPLR